MARILVVEDDPQTASEINAALGDYGFAVDCAATGREGLLKAASDPYDGHRARPHVAGRARRAWCAHRAEGGRGRSAGADPERALSAVDERVRGLRAGGDDYMTKPLDFLELTARLDILLRRHAGPQRETTLRVSKLEMDLLKHTVHLAGTLVELLPREFRLL